MLQKLNLYAYFLPKMNSYRRDFDKTKCISFLIKDENLGKKSATLSTSTAAVDPRHLKVEVTDLDFPNCSYVINKTCHIRC